MGDGDDAEKAFLQIDYSLMFSGSQEMMHSAIDEFVNIIDSLPAVRGVTQEIDFFWIALVVTQVNYVHRPRYKLQIYEEIAEKYYRSQKLCRRKVRNFFT